MSSDSVHFKLTHNGRTNRFALTRTDDPLRIEEMFSAVRQRVATIVGSPVGNFHLAWKDVNSPAISPPSFPLDTSGDLQRAIAFISHFDALDEHAKNKPLCLHLTVAFPTPKEETDSCYNCMIPLAEAHFQCPSKPKHMFCTDCTRRIIKQEFTKKEINCPSGKKCPAKGDFHPWSFTVEMLQECLGEEFDGFMQKRTASREAFEAAVAGLAERENAVPVETEIERTDIEASDSESMRKRMTAVPGKAVRDTHYLLDTTTYSVDAKSKTDKESPSLLMDYLVAEPALYDPLGAAQTDSSSKLATIAVIQDPLGASEPLQSEQKRVVVNAPASARNQLKAVEVVYHPLTISEADSQECEPKKVTKTAASNTSTSSKNQPKTVQVVTGPLGTVCSFEIVQKKKEDITAIVVSDPLGAVCSNEIIEKKEVNAAELKTPTMNKSNTAVSAPLGVTCTLETVEKKDIKTTTSVPSKINSKTSPVFKDLKAASVMFDPLGAVAEVTEKVTAAPEVKKPQAKAVAGPLKKKKIEVLCWMQCAICLKKCDEIIELFCENKHQFCLPCARKAIRAAGKANCPSGMLCSGAKINGKPVELAESIVKGIFGREYRQYKREKDARNGVQSPEEELTEAMRDFLKTAAADAAGAARGVLQAATAAKSGLSKLFKPARSDKFGCSKACGKECDDCRDMTKRVSELEKKLKEEKKVKAEIEQLKRSLNVK